MIFVICNYRKVFRKIVVINLADGRLKALKTSTILSFVVIIELFEMDRTRFEKLLDEGLLLSKSEKAWCGWVFRHTPQVIGFSICIQRK